MEKKIYKHGSIQILENFYPGVPTKELDTKIQKYCKKELGNFITYYLTNHATRYKGYSPTRNKTCNSAV